MSPCVSEEINETKKRTWLQKVLIFAGIASGVLIIAASIRLASFEDAVESIVRIEVPVGVLAELPTAPQNEALKDINEKVFSDSDPEPQEVKPHPAGPPRNILLVGTDSAVGLDPDDPAANRDRSAGIGLADTIMIVRLDPALAKATIMSLPRDLYVTIYREGNPVRSEKLASALLVGGLEKGAPTLVETITNNFDIPIHNFAIVDFFGFETLVDELNGVPLWFPYPVRDVASGLMVLEAGCTTLDGRDSLAFVRSRKLEAFINGDWNRVGVWNDLERNQRQQDFLIRTIQRAIGKGARSVIVQDDLIRAGAEAVVLDDRLSIAELLKLGRAFSDFNPSDLERTLLPVVDAVIGASAVLELGEGADSSFGVFRGESLTPNDISIRIIDSRGKNKNADEITDEIARRGFKADMKQGETTGETVIKFSLDDYEAAVLLGRFIQPIPKFELVNGSSENLTLIIGEDFEALPLMPKTFEEVDARARPSLPVSEKLLGSNEEASGVINLDKPLLPLRQGEISPMKLVKEIDGQPPSGQKCG